MALRVFETPIGAYEISYLIEGEIASPKVLVLHGWGANKELMRQTFSRFFGSFRALYVDLPGFGASKTERVMTSADYAAVIRAVLAELDFAPHAIVAHSFGGKIAALLDPPLLVLLSSAGILKPKSKSVRLKIALAKIFKPFFSGALRNRLRANDARGISETMYETFKNVVKEDFAPVFAARDKKTLIFWGKSDPETPLFCGEKMHSLIKDSEFFALSGDHFFFTAHSSTIAKTIKETIGDS
ncbi:hydrolase [Campylobacterota bacterium]|nr:hydrolase [Campylobacterota bacterium]